MISISGGKGRSRPIALCPRCRREILPRLKESPWHADVHRRAASGMVTEPDPKAQRIKARKDRKRATKQYMTRGTLAAVRLTLLTRNAKLDPPPSDDCPTCAALQRKRERLAA